MMEFLLDRVKTTWEKKKIPVIQHFLLFPQCFENVLLLGLCKVAIYGKRIDLESILVEALDLF